MISKEKVIHYRKLRGFTQEKLSLESGLSLRTIQRIEKGTSEGSPHTLQSLSEALGISNEDLFIDQTKAIKPTTQELSKLKTINLSAFSVVLIPMGNLIFPFIFYWKSRSTTSINTMGRKIISFQIIWTFASLFILLFSPFLRDPINRLFQSEIFTASKMPLFMYVVLAAFNVLITVKIANSINRKESIPSFIPNIL